MLRWDPAVLGKSEIARVEKKNPFLSPPPMKQVVVQIMKVMLTAQPSKPVYKGYLLLSNLKVKD